MNEKIFGKKMDGEMSEPTNIKHFDERLYKLVSWNGWSLRWMNIYYHDSGSPATDVSTAKGEQRTGLVRRR